MHLSCKPYYFILLKYQDDTEHSNRVKSMGESDKVGVGRFADVIVGRIDGSPKNGIDHQRG